MIKRNYPLSVILIAANFTFQPANAENLTSQTAHETCYEICIKKATGTTEYLSCIQIEHKREDKRLNSEYQKVIKTLSQKRKIQLKAVQLSWLKYRQQKCSFFYHTQSGSGRLLDMEQCLLDETTHRANELAELY